MYANGTKIYQFKAKDPKIKPYQLCLGNISKYFLLDNMKKESTVKWIHVSVDYNTIDISDI